MNAKRKRDIMNVFVRVGAPILVKVVAGAIASSIQSNLEAKRTALEIEKLDMERQELLNEPFGKWRNRDKILEIDREIFYMGGK